WDPSGLDRGAQQACFQRQVPTYLIVANTLRIQWGPLLAPGVGACYACLAGKLHIPESLRLADQRRWLNPQSAPPQPFPPFAAEAAALAMPEVLLFLTGMLSADQLQRTSFFHVPGRNLSTVSIGPEAMCAWCGVGTPAFAKRSQLYARLDVRPMAFAGKSYPADAEEADVEVGAYLRHAQAPPATMPQGIIAPHIEPRLGQISYGHAYGAFPVGRFPRRFIVLSTSHYPQSRVVALSAKPFATPWGLVQVDGTAVDRIAKAVGGNPFADEALFGYEHAIEFPTIFLERARRQAGAPPITVVPVLCGSLHEAMVRQRHPMEMGEVAAFVGMLQELVAEDPDGTCIVSSIDLSHVGPRYGDPNPLNPDQLATVRAWDQRLLGQLAAGQSTEYWETVASVNNGTRICGLTPMFLQVAALPDCRGETRHYELSLDEASRSHIGHAAMLLHPTAF
ncbi:MAG: AmmeMemoRadiSam system protein B, partial [Candidatus Sericytochromatia bacterium]|nr:AmmeMemoRadiSam system protein B [Candidatus Sericytochromatia bacterium]